ncbi:hypothetical protein BLS_009451 [Venturia inaequalis]|uniref:Uncharacterized protein n=1 Tax=Venturia inaequalis TaxID=5025 RepID=A0A8H3YJX1_VENIN|nr:hypothetical protein BLS_009451 [Venturia inaequalis]KAE9979401.1 hypothetical protein EG328_000886 [Venturia inaequalis]KAE9991282.1 hypothetical protein EG327_000171 [Venturia inaequalis]
MARGGAGGFAVTRLFTHDEELGKKDDDYPPKHSRPGLWNSSTTPSSAVRYRTRKRWITISAALFAVWLFWHFMPADILEPSPHPLRPGMGRSSQNHQGKPGKDDFGAPRGPPPGFGKGMKVKQEERDHFFDGDIRFYRLPHSLHAISQTNGFQRMNKNVMFAASNLKSLAVLIPMACEMGRWDKSVVHVAITARSELSLKEIQSINGVDENDCKVSWHDARPDYPRYSSEFRAEAAVATAMDHIEAFMHPQVVITDDSMAEDTWFTRQIRLKAKQYDWPVIELPTGKQDRLKWMTRLDARALAAWHRSSVDIVIQAPTSGFGALMRLLKSLSAADYSGLTPPRITIELPAEVDAMTRDYLSHYVWPPSTALQPVHSSQLTVRHRIPGQKISAEAASVRFFESFYPARAEESHALLLSANAQLSPVYFHYLKYNLLHYKYSESTGIFSLVMAGISLDLPSEHLNGSAPFTPPDYNTLESAVRQRTKPVHKKTNPPFLWEAPNNNAALYFGEKWVELHSFLQHRLTKFHNTPDAAVLHKTVSEQRPAWMEYALEFMRARGYSLLYPASSPNFDALVTIHQEQYHVPEEFTAASTTSAAEATAPPKPLNEPFLAPKPAAILAPKSNEHQLAAMSKQKLDAILPYQGEEPDLTSIPKLAFNGLPLQTQEVFALADTFASSFRKEVGGCKEDWKAGRIGEVKDLFC